ncbi:MAG: tRNA pseudouridine(55) synthase TruB [Vicinamibacteraceae bacterium]
MMLDGVLVVDKPAGLTSHDVVAAARRAAGQKRVGHTGTLDPFATGVLALVLGRATRLSRFLTASTKRYVAGVRLGVATDTYDVTGVPAGEPSPARVVDAIDASTIEPVLARFRGTLEQAPPPFSAKKIGGVRAYTLARRNVAVAPPPVTVTVHECRVVSVEQGLVTLDISCSAGCYVRSLAHDLGAALGVGAHLECLRRTASGELTIDQAISLAALVEGGATAAGARLVPLDELLGDYPGARLTETGVEAVRHGRAVRPSEVCGWLGPSSVEDRPIRLLASDGQLVALATRAAVGGGPASLLRPTVVLV